MSQPILQPVLSNRKRREFRICPVCGVEFCVIDPNQRWCSGGVPSWTRQARHQSNVPRHEVPDRREDPVMQPILSNRKQPRFGVCPVCQVEFLAEGNDNQRTCSKACSQRARSFLATRPDALLQEGKLRDAEKPKPFRSP